MRVSANKDDPGFCAFTDLRGRGYAVFASCDGVNVPKAITADEEEGFVRRAVRDADGHLVAKDGELVIETLRGQVEITWRKAADG